MGLLPAVAAILGGDTMQEIAGMNTTRDMNRTTQNELARQQAFQKQGTGVFQQSLGQSTPQAMESQLAQGQKQAGDMYQQLQALPMQAGVPGLPSQATLGANVTDQAGQAQTQQSNQAGAANTGYGNLATQQGLKDLSARSQLGVIGGNSRQSAAVLPYELQQDQGNWQWLQALGQLLSSGGGLMGSMGSSMSAPSGGAQASGIPYAQGMNANTNSWASQAPFMQQQGMPWGYGYGNQQNTTFF